MRIVVGLLNEIKVKQIIILPILGIRCSLLCVVRHSSREREKRRRNTAGCIGREELFKKHDGFLFLWFIILNVYSQLSTFPNMCLMRDWQWFNLQSNDENLTIRNCIS